MKRYHLKSNGEPALCEAQEGNCPLGGAHFSSETEARENYETEMQENLLNNKLKKAFGFRSPDWAKGVDKKHVQDFALDFADDIANDPECMPPVDDPNKPDGIPEEEGYIDSLEAFKDPALAMGNCSVVAEAIKDYQNNSNIIDIIEEEVNGPYLNTHVANLYQDDEGDPWVIDYTYSQVDPKADWPWVGTVKDWRENVQKAGFTPAEEIKAIYAANSK